MAELATLNFSLAAVCLYAALFHFGYFLNHPRQREHLHFSLLAVFLAVYELCSGNLNRSASFELSASWQRGQFASINAFALFLIPYILRLLRERKPRLERALAIATLAFLVLGLVLPGSLTVEASRPALKNWHALGLVRLKLLECEPGLFYQLNYLFLAALMGYSLVLMARKARTPGKRPIGALLVSIILFYFAAFHDILMGAGFLHSLYLLDFALFGLVLAMAWTLLSEITGIQKRFEDLNLDLERQVQTRTEALMDLNQQLSESNLMDPLTGVHNRRYIDERFVDYIVHYHRRRRQDPFLTLGLVLLDIDHFKNVNDTRGHATGDVALRAVANRLRALVRVDDVVVRWGGEEFLIILNGTDGAFLELFCRKIRESMNAGPIPIPGEAPLPLTVSGGAVPFPLGAVTPSVPHLDACVSLADQALYLAKHTGRNRLVLIDGQRVAPQVDPRELVQRIEKLDPTLPIPPELPLRLIAE